MGVVRFLTERLLPGSLTFQGHLVKAGATALEAGVASRGKQAGLGTRKAQNPTGRTETEMRGQNRRRRGQSSCSPSLVNLGPVQPLLPHPRGPCAHPSDHPATRSPAAARRPGPYLPGKVTGENLRMPEASREYVGANVAEMPRCELLLTF